MDFLNKYVELGYSFFNTGTLEKKCLTSWTQYQKRKPNDIEMNRWSNSSIQNYAIVCGEISNLIVFDVDTKNGADPSPYQNTAFYEVPTPSGGNNFYCKYNPLLFSTKHKKEKHDGILFAVDVQSNGAIVFAPPSFFQGKGGYEIINDVPIIDIPDDLLIAVLDALEPEKKSNDYTPFVPRKIPEMGRPGDVFNALASWDDVLIPLGWQKVGKSSDKNTTFWRRPGKKDGISASTNWKGYDLFFPFTSSVENLVPMKGYTKFALLATLKYGGDFKKTAFSLVVENYKIASKLI